MITSKNLSMVGDGCASGSELGTSHENLSKWSQMTVRLTQPLLMEPYALPLLAEVLSPKWRSKANARSSLSGWLTFVVIPGRWLNLYSKMTTICVRNPRDCTHRHLWQRDVLDNQDDWPHPNGIWAEQSVTESQSTVHSTTWSALLRVKLSMVRGSGRESLRQPPDLPWAT